MIGSGFAFAILPGLRHLYRADEPRFRDALDLHVEHFNAHPYLSNVALGAVLRLEADGTDPSTIRRFKVAVRSPLGGIGDSLVWATWLPTVSMLAVAAYWLGLPGWAAVTLFLVLYNVAHVGLRAWGFHAGLTQGQGVGTRLRAVAFNHWTSRLRVVASGVLGILAGAVFASPDGLADSGVLWTALATAGFIAGAWNGHALWRPAAVAIVAAVGFLTAWGMTP